MATIVNSRDLALQLGGRVRTTATAAEVTAYIELSAPTINKSAVDAATSGVHTNITATGKIEIAGVLSTGGFLTITANGDTEASTATANTITTTIADSAGKSSYTIKLYDSAAIATAKILDYKIIPVQFTKVGSGQIIAGSIGTAQFGTNLEPVTFVSGSLPTTRVTYAIYYNGRLYYWNGTAYTTQVPATDVGNGLTSAQIADLDATKLTGSIAAARIGAIIDSTKIATGLELVANSSAGSLPTTFLGELLRWNQKLYRWTGSVYTAAVPAADVGNGLTSAQISDLDASKLSGTLNAARIALNSIAGDRIISLEAAKLSTQIQTTNIADDAISSPKILAGAVIAGKLAASSVTANNLVVTDSDSVYPDPLFEDQAWWNGNVGSTTQYAWPTGFSVGTSVVWPTTRALLVNPTSGYKNSMSREFRIEPEASYRVKLWIYMTSSFAGEITALLHLPNVAWKPLGGVPTSGVMTGDTGIPKINNSLIAKDQWVTFEDTALNPIFNNANNYANLRIAAQVTAGTCHIAVRIVRAANASLIVDGAITTDKMTANTINGDRITGNTLNASKIVAGSITTDRMTANTIHGDVITGNTLNASKIVSDSITAAQIATGAITADEIAAGTITANKIVIADFTNLVENPTMAIGNVGWPTQENGWAFNTVGGEYGGPTYYRNGNASVGAIRNGFLVKAQAGDQFFATARVYCNVAAANQIYVRVTAQRATSPFEISLGEGYSVNNTATWQTISVNVTFPVDYTTCRLEVVAVNTTGTVVLGSAKLLRRNTSELIVDGAITTSKMTANSIDGDRITANTLNAAKILAGTITTDRMTANTINGNVITGGTLAGNKIVAGDISANEIAAGAITASKLKISPANLCPDSSFNDTAFWEGARSHTPGWFLETTHAYLNSRAMTISLAISGGLTANIFQYSKNLNFSNIGKSLRLRARGWNQTNRAILVYAEFRNAANGFLSNFSVQFNAGTGVQTLTNIASAPDGTEQLVFIIYCPAGAALSGAASVTDISLDVAAESSLIVDGAITTQKMTANSIHGDRITADTLNASKIAAGSITTDRMTANSIHGDRITADTLNASKIAAGSITTDRMTANSINGDRIVANTLNASKIVSGSITTGKLTVTNNTAVNPDPLYYDSEIWAQATAWPSYMNNAEYNGSAGTWPQTRALRFSASGGNFDIASKFFPTEALGYYRAKVYIYISSAFAGSVGVWQHYPSEAWFEMGIPRSGTIHNTLPGIDISLSRNTWLTYEGTFRPGPSSNTNMGFSQFRFAGNITAGEFYIIIQLERSASADLIVDGAITTNKMTANSINADRLTAGTITADKLTIGGQGRGAASLVRNSDWTDYTGTNSGIAALSGWGQQSTASGASIGRNWGSGAIYNLGRGGFYLFDSEVGGGGEWGIYQQIPQLIAGVVYELHVKGNLHRCGGRATIHYLNSAGTYLGETSVTFTNPGAGTTNDGTILSQLGWGTGTAPAGTTKGTLYILKNKTNSGQSNSYAFFNEVFLAPASPGASAANPTPYRTQGMVEINGGAIVANTVTADKITATSLESLSATIGLLRTASSGSRTEIQDNVIRVYEGSTLRVKIGNLA